ESPTILLVDELSLTKRDSILSVKKKIARREIERIERELQMKERGQQMKEREQNMQLMASFMKYIEESSKSKE
ncbi:unnamed protein product, partial [Aphanomyces euteiches]